MNLETYYFTPMALEMDSDTIEACLTSGMIVIVEIDSKDMCRISGIVSAHTSVNEAYDAYIFEGRDVSNDYAIVIPQECGPAIYYSWLTLEEMKERAGL